MTASAIQPAETKSARPARLERYRGPISVTLVVLASISFLVGAIVLYAREEIVSTPAFADRAADALAQPQVQNIVSREITVQLLEPALPDAVAARPVVQTAVKLAIGTPAFRSVFRLAAVHAHRLLFSRGRNAVFDIADAGSVISSALRTLAPKIAAQIPARTDAILMTLRRRGFADTTLRVADAIRVLGWVLPFVALALYAAAIAVARDRRRAITRSAVGLGMVTVVFAIVFELFRRYAVAHVYGGGDLSNSSVRGAVDELWGSFFDDLMTWTLVFAAGAWLLAAASSSVLAPYSAARLIHRSRAFLASPKSSRVRGLQGAIALVIGIFVIVKPTLSLRVVAVACGCLLVYFGFGELLTVTAPAQRRARRRRVPSRRVAIGFGGAGAAVVAGVIAAVVLTGASPTRAAPTATCNGYAQLCNRRLDEVSFAGTHNSMSASDSPGWYIANQDRNLAQQLDDGIRAFKISTHYGTEDSSGFVHTDLTAENAELNRVAAKLIPDARAALQRVSKSLSRGAVGKREVWLCHTLCELGATSMVSFFQTIRRFLELNPNQVLVFFDEDAVKEQDVRSAFVRAGVFKYLARLQPGQPLPTLGQLIHAHKNIVVFSQERTSGHFPWNPYAFNWMEDTPLGAVKPAQFTCKLNRGQAGNPILLMNNWADIFPPRPSPNVPLVKSEFILSRAQQCAEQRGRVPNLILTDYYNRGKVVGAVNALNGVAAQPPAKVIPVSSSD
jgi:hypothetical protein